MKKFVASLVAAAALFASPAIAADMMPVKAPRAAPAAASPWDFAFGGALMSDYNFRGISQSDRGPSVTAYSEIRYNVNADFQLYIASQYWAVDLPTHPSCECDFYGGIRPTIGPLSFDFGGMYYFYPRERQVFTTAANAATFVAAGNTVFSLRNTDFWEAYGKVTWDVVKDKFAVGANAFYAPSWLNTGASGTFASVTAKVTMPSFNLALGPWKEIGWYISGEFGHYWLGRTTNYPAGANFDIPDYSTWNVGLAFTAGVFTVDLRYYDTDLTRGQCFAVTGDLRGLTGGTNPAGTSRWCNPTFIVATKFDLVASKDLK